MGTITPIGLNVKDYWTSLITGHSGIGKSTRFDTSEFSVQIAAEVKNFNPDDFDIDSKKAKRIDMFIQYALAAAKEAFESSGLNMEKENSFRCGTIIGSGIGGLQTVEDEHIKLREKGPKRVSPFLIPGMIIDMAAGQVAIEYGLNGINYAVVSACASSAHAIGDSFKMIQAGVADIIFAGGTEYSTTPVGLAGFCSAKALSKRNDDPQKACRPFDAERDGFVMSEGAGILILEELEHAKNRGANILAEVAGYGATADAYHMTAPHPDGAGGANAMRIAIEDAGLNIADVDYINAHGTSTPLNDKIETGVIKQVFGDHARKLAINSTKSMAGHLLGAAGAVEIIATIKSINEGVLHPTVNYENPDPECDLDYVPNEAREQEINVGLSNSLGFGGHNAAVIVSKFTG
jgi:3-oxoacyl-[acyl-carrier-protein] synthase II